VVVTTGVGVRFLVVGQNLPLLVAGLYEDARGPELAAALVERGLVEIPRFLGVDLPRGAQLGFSLTSDELRLVDEQDATLMRAPRASVDEAWLEHARRLKGTMFVAARELELDPDQAPRELAERVDERARAGAAMGGIVGFSEERPTLPLLGF
jgi:hypothetical protein